MKRKGMFLVAAIAVLAGLIGAAGATGAAGSEEAAPKCAGGQDATKVTVGVVQMVGCWTETVRDGAKYYLADFSRQPAYGDKQIRGVDMNGFLVGSARAKGQLVVNSKTYAIQSRMIGEDESTEAVLYSLGYPNPKNPTQMGQPFKINFTAPNQGSVLLEDFRFGDNSAYANTLDGFSPVGDVETPVKLSDDGTGSMDLTVQLAGIFTLKGRPQSVSILIPSKVGEGSKLDGFEIKLEAIDAIKLIDIREFEAKYSAAEERLGGSADFKFPFMGDRGVAFTFEIEKKMVSKASVGVSGLKIPIGGAGFLTSLNGGFGFTEVDRAFFLNLNAAATAEFGPEVPTPWGKVVPLEVSSALKIGKEKQDFYFLFDGGVRVFRLNVGSVYVKIHSNSGVQFGFSVGVGFPSYANNPNDPFYIGAGVDGWVAKRKFQFEGRGRVRLIGLDIFDGRILINDRAAGACWKVTWFDGGAVYEYGQKDVQTFGVSCGLDRYRENYPAATRQGVAAVSADRPRKLETGAREVVLSARGQGDAPRFRLTSNDGRTLDVPRGKDAVRTKRHMIVVDRENDVTHVAAGALPNRKWTITPHPDSVPILGVKTGKALKPEKVRARIVGKGLTRTLVWDSRGNPNTRIAFSEVQGNFEQPILVTDKVKGRHTFKVVKGTQYGKRRLRAVVIHGGTPREATIEDHYRVRRPGKLRAPRLVRAWRNVYRAAVVWKGVPGARGYVAEIAVKKNGRRVSSYRRLVGPNKRRIVIPSHPGGGWAIASVQALNADEKPGRTGTKRFRLAPPKKLTLKQAGRQAARSAVRAGGKVKVRTLCPTDGHCQTRVLLKLGKRTVGSSRFQQVPGTYWNVVISPKSAKLKRRLARGRLNRLRVVVRQHRAGVARARVFASGVDGA
jgi:hypothetical protein